MKISTKIAALMGMGLFPFAATYAQQDSTLNRTVVVENEYNPRVMDASKINVLPKVEEPKIMKRHIDYATSVRALSQRNNQVMSPMLREWAKNQANRGYLRGGYGNKGNVEGAFGYLWDVTKNDRLTLDASLGGWDGTIDSESEMEWKSRFYRSMGGLEYQHQFKGMALNLGGNLKSQVFTYMPYLKAEPGAYGGHQHQTMANAHAGLKSTDTDLSWQFEGEAGWNMFQMKHPASLKENEIYVKGGLWKNLGDGQLLGAGVNFHNYSYSGEGDWKGATLLQAVPSYTLVGDEWKLRVGVHLDWWNGEDNELKLAPDVNFEYQLWNGYVLYARACGGMQNASFREWTDITPFWMPFSNVITPTHVSLDAALGLKASPAPGWWFHVTGGYQIRENDLNLAYTQSECPTYILLVPGKNKVAYGSAELKYDVKNFGFSLSGTYYNWKYNGDEAEPVLAQQPLALRPELAVQADAWLELMEGWKIMAGYDYEKRCEDTFSAVSDLHVGATCQFMKNVEVFGRVHNLLNQSYVRPDGYSAQKLHFLAGLSLYF